MKKLTLRIDELSVESFCVVEREEQSGTVWAHADTRGGDTCITQCATGPCDCMLTEPDAC